MVFKNTVYDDNTVNLTLSGKRAITVTKIAAYLFHKKFIKNSARISLLFKTTPNFLI